MEPGFPQDVPSWINTFEGLSSTCNDVSELCDGVALSEIMAQIAPSSYFDFDLVRGSNSWASHKINLSYLVRGLEEYYKAVHDKEFVLDFIDLDRIAQDNDLNELAVLMEFVVGAAVQCPDKQRYIGNIMSMSEDSQQTLMSLAKSLMQRPASDGTVPQPSSTNTGDASGVDSDDLAQLRSQVQGLESSNEDLAQQLESCKADLDAQKKLTSEEVEQARSALQEGFDAVKRQNSDLRQELDLAQERERELRTTLQGDYEERSEKDVVKWESMVRRLEEEKDIMASKLEDYSKLKSQSERLREKMEDMGTTSKSLKERLAVVEESNAKRLDRILELEGMEKERDFNKKKIEQYKNTAKDLELKVLKMASEAQVKDQDAISLAEELKHAQEKARNLEHELEDSKRELQEASEGQADAGRALSGLAQDFVPPDVAEKLVRLERENEALKAQLEDPSSPDADARIESLQIEAEDRERRVAEGENEALQLKRDLSKAQADSAISKERFEARIVELEKQVSSMQPKLSSNKALTETVNKLNDDLKKRESENNKLTSDKEKLEAYTKKALHNVQEKYMLAIKTCKEQLKEKDDRIQKLTDQYKQYRQQSQREAQLMSSAIYELGMNITEQRLVRNLDRTGPKQSTWIQGQRDSARKSSLQGGI